MQYNDRLVCADSDLNKATIHHRWRVVNRELQKSYLYTPHKMPLRRIFCHDMIQTSTVSAVLGVETLFICSVSAGT